MEPRKLTARQTETLRHIYEFVAKNGAPPTIDDLRRAMAVASDQGVIEILQRLVDRGMIERTPGQARGLKLTADAYLAIGVTPAQSGRRSSLSVAGGNQLELSLHQQRILKRLTEIDPKLARMYEGGLRVLLDETNPERIPLSAHSIRESTSHLSDMGKELLTKEEVAAAKASSSSNARQLERLFDPLGGARHFGQTIYDTWNREFHGFFVKVCHHGLEVGIEEYRLKLAEFEEFLSQYVLPRQTEIYTLLDDQLSKGPANATADKLKLLLTRTLESYRYFFRKADVRWLGFLNRHGLLFPRWETADYFARIAGEASEDVMAIIEGMKVDDNDWSTRRGFVDAAIKMPPNVARRLIKKVEAEKWLTGPAADWLSHILSELLAILIADSQHEDALRLAKLMIQGDNGVAYLRDFYFGEVLKNLSAVAAPDLAPYIKLLVQSLGMAIAHDGPNGNDDRSLMWRPAIENNPQNWRHGESKDHLVIALRDAMARHLAHLRSLATVNVSAALDALLESEPPYAIFTRVQLHFYRQELAQFMPQIEQVLVDQFDGTNTWHEYFLLIKDSFPHLQPSMRLRYFELIDNGPKKIPDEHYVNHWKARKLAVVVDHLSESELARYQDLLEAARKIAHPDFLSHHTAGWVGPTSPTDESALAAMPIEDLIEHLASWEPPKDMWFSSSRDGLGRLMGTVVGKNAEAFAKQAHRFLDARIRPVYLYQFFFGLQHGFKNGAHIDWQNVLALATGLVKQAEAGTLPAFSVDKPHDEWEAQWSGTFQAIANLLEDSLRNDTEGPAFTHRAEIRRILEFLCEHPDPTPEYEKEYGGNNMEPVTLSINTVRGRAFHALFSYIFWCDRHLSNKGENGSRIPQEAKDILEAHLDPARDSSLAVRSVYGQHFPWLVVFDPAWATSIVDRLFPAKDSELRYAAWETYLSNAVFPQVYPVLRPQYEQAISEARKFKANRRYWADPIVRLADHMMVAYAYRMEEEKGAVWAKFFQSATPEQRGMAVSFAGRVCIHASPARTGDTPPSINRLQEFWEWRLAESKEADELKEFGWWVTEGKFNDEWMLTRLIETLKKTGGTTATDFEVLRTLSVLVAKQAKLCVQALSLIVKSRSADRWMFGHSQEIRDILSTAYASPDAETKDIAFDAIDHLTKLGFEHYRDILELQQPKPLDATTL
jgi:hypothetical protein